MSNNIIITDMDTNAAYVWGNLVTDTQIRQMEWQDLVGVLDNLPGYTNLVLEMVSMDRGPKWRLMARDIPRPGRRYTNLDTGMEWIGLNEIISNNDCYGIAVWTADSSRMLCMAMVERDESGRPV